MCDQTRRDRIRNENIQNKVKVASMGQDAGSKVEMVRTCEEEIHGCSNTEVMDGFRRGRGKPKKY